MVENGNTYKAMRKKTHEEYTIKKVNINVLKYKILKVQEDIYADG